MSITQARLCVNIPGALGNVRKYCRNIPTDQSKMSGRKHYLTVVWDVFDVVFC